MDKCKTLNLPLLNMLETHFFQIWYRIFPALFLQDSTKNILQKLETTNYKEPTNGRTFKIEKIGEI